MMPQILINKFNEPVLIFWKLEAQAAAEMQQFDPPSWPEKIMKLQLIGFDICILEGSASSVNISFCQF